MNEDLRSFLKKESLKIFDHEYDILYALVKDKEIASGVRFFAVYYGGYLFTYIRSNISFVVLGDAVRPFRWRRCRRCV